MCGCGGEFDSQVPGVEGFLHLCGVGLDEGEGAEAVALGERCVAGFALLAAKAGGAEINLG